MWTEFGASYFVCVCVCVCKEVSKRFKSNIRLGFLILNKTSPVFYLTDCKY